MTPHDSKPEVCPLQANAEVTIYDIVIEWLRANRNQADSPPPDTNDGDCTAMLQDVVTQQRVLHRTPSGQSAAETDPPHSAPDQ